MASGSVVESGDNHTEIVPDFLKYIDQLPSAPTDRYKTKCLIGRGGFGDIFEARYSNNEEGPRFAMKFRKIVNLRSNSCVASVSNYERMEIHALRVLGQQEHIIQLHDIIRMPGSIALVMNLCRIDLARVIRLNKKIMIDDTEKRTIMSQLFKGIAAIHQQRLIHRDIKPANILISCEGIVKIADFGLATRTADQSPDGKLSPYVGTYCYRPMEMLLGDEEYDEKVDMWSAGCTMAELWTNRVIFRGKSAKLQVKEIAKYCGYPDASVWPKAATLRWFELHKSACESYVVDRVMDKAMMITSGDYCASYLVDQLLKVNPNDRPSASIALNSIYFALGDVAPDLKGILAKLARYE